MIVDDNKDAADTLAMMLELQGNHVWTSYGGQDALAVAAVHEPELIFVDLGMPQMDGFELARRIRSMPTQSTAVLVALTWYGSAEDRQRTQESGFDAHVVKPVEATVLVELLAGLPRIKSLGAAP